MQKNHHPHWAIMELAELEAPAQSIHLLSKLNTGKRTAERRKYLTTRLTAALFLAVFALVSLFFVPEVRAFAEDIFQRMGIAFVNTEQFGDTEIVEAEPAIPSHEPIVSLSLEELRAQISFPLLIPAQMPESLDYVRRETRDVGSGAQVYLTYARTTDFDIEQGVLMLIAYDGPITAPPLLAASKEEPVRVNGQVGIYVHGGWQDNGQGDPHTKFGDLLWDDTIDSTYLTWEQWGVTYLLQAHQLGFELEDLLQIAASMSE